MRGAHAGSARPADQSEMRQLSIVTSKKTDTDMNAPENAARAKGARSTEASQLSGATTSGPTLHVAPGTQQGENSDPARSHPPQTLDRWFDEQLNRLFNDVSSEPLPTDLANLVSQLRAQGSKPDDR